MAAIGAHPKHRPPITLYICKSEQEATTKKGTRVSDTFVWKDAPHNKALWAYLKVHAHVADWQSIHFYDKKGKAYHLSGARMDEAYVAKMQYDIASGPNAVSIYLVLKSGAVPKNRTTLPALARPALSPAARAASDIAGLRDLLRDLDNMSTRYHNKYHV